MSKTKIKVHQSDSLAKQLTDRLTRIRTRAFEIFERRGAKEPDRAFDDWLKAERELAVEPPIDLSSTEDGYELAASLPGIDADDVVVEATREDVLISAERRTRHHRKETGGAETVVSLFRVIHFPEAIDPDRVKADYREGLLRVKAIRAKTAGPAAVQADARPSLEAQASTTV